MIDETSPLRLGFVRGVAPSRWQERWHRVRSRRRMELVPIPEVFDVRPDGVDVVLVRSFGGEFPAGSRGDHRDRHAVQLYEEQVALVVERDHELATESQIDADLLELVQLLDHPGHDPAWPAPAAWQDPSWRPDTVAGALDLVSTGLGGVLAPLPAARHLADKRYHRVIEVTGIDALPRVFAAWNIADDGNEIQELIGVLRGRTPRSSR